MKKALVRKSDDKVDRSLYAQDADSLMTSTPYQQTYYSVDIPVALEAKEVSELKSVLIPASAEYWSDGTTTYNAIVNVPTIIDANSNVIPDPAFIHYPAIAEHHEIQEDLVASKENAIQGLKSVAKSEVLAQMLLVFGSNDMNTNQANYSTWEKMVAKPASFSVASLSAQVDVYDATDTNITIAKGTALSTDALVLEYASYRVDRKSVV